MSFNQLPVPDFLEALAAKVPTPGGGAAASIVAALAASLARMVVNYSLGKKSLAAHEALHRHALDELAALSAKALRLADADAEAYGRLNALWKLDKADPKRIAEFPAAVEAAIEAPHAVLHTAMEILRLLQRLSPHSPAAPGGTTNAMLKSDLAIAAILAEAAARAAAWNVRINLPLLEDEPVRRQFESTIAKSLDSAAQLAAAVEKACA